MEDDNRFFEGALSGGYEVLDLEDEER
jgi:hypothetical protein